MPHSKVVSALLALILVAQVQAQYANVVSFAYNVFGQLGRNDTSNPPTNPWLGAVALSEKVTKVSYGYYHSLFLTASGTLYGAGECSPTNGRLAQNGACSNRVAYPIPTTDPSGVLTGKTIKTIAATNSASYIVTTAGELYSFGKNNAGALGVGGSTATVSDKPVWVNTAGLAIVDVAVGDDSVVLLTSNGSIMAFGSNSNYLMGDGTQTNVLTPTLILDFYGVFVNVSFTQISVGKTLALALGNNTIYSWGSSNMGRPGSNDGYPKPITDVNGVFTNRTITYISAGSNFAVITTSDGNAFGWGTNSNGNLCRGDTISVTYASSITTQLPSNVFLIKVVAANTYTMMLASDGNVYGCGQNGNGNLGLGNQVGPVLIPTRVALLDAFTTSTSRPTDVIVNSALGSSTFVLFGNATATTTAAPTTTSTPTTTTTPTTAAPTTATPTTTAAPTTATPTTAAPTTATPTTSTQAPTTTSTPTTTSPSPTPTGDLLSFTRQGTLTSVINGDASKVPKPTVNSSLVLFSNATVNVTLPCSLSGEVSLPNKAIMSSATFSFNISSIKGPADIIVMINDEQGSQAGNLTVRYTTPGYYTVNMRDLFAKVLSENTQDFSIRIVRGSILKVALGIASSDVPVEIEPAVTSTIAYYNTQQTTQVPATTVSPATTTTSPSGTPVTTKVSAATNLSLSVLLLTLVALLFN